MNCSEDLVPRESVVNGYTFHEALGTGAFSAVYRVTKEAESGDPDTFAMKVIPKANIGQDGDPERLQRELDTMAFLKHPNIVTMHDFFSDPQNFYLVLDFCKGGDLADYLVSQPPLREQQVATVFRQIVSAISFVHSHGVAHRDLKPQNILITTFPNIKVTDFGLCGYTDDQKMKTFCGSPCYTAPECLSGVQYDGDLADVWSLGVILYEMVTGHHPWNVTNIPKMVKQICEGRYVVPSSVTPACDDLIKGMMKVRASDRLTCERVLAHPWMKLAPSRAKGPTGGLPPLLRNSLASFTRTIDRENIRADHGIVSPFEGHATGSLNAGEAPPTVPRSRSGTFVQPKGRKRQNSVQPMQMRRSMGSPSVERTSEGKSPRPIPLPRVQTPH